MALDDQQNPPRSTSGLSLAALCNAGGLLPRAERLFRSGCYRPPSGDVLTLPDSKRSLDVVPGHCLEWPLCKVLRS